MKKIIISLLCFVGFLSASVERAAALEFESFRLSNGMDVYVVPDHRAPVVVNFVWYRIGAADEEEGKTGLAHMLEHLMFKGTADISSGEFSKIIARNGGRDNAFTSMDYTAYFQKIAKKNLPVAMKMEADRMANLQFTDAEFQPERDVIMEERRWRVDSKPVPQFFEALHKVHFPTHPYGRPVIGYKQDIENYTREDALSWYKNWYTPSNAVLILVGDITLTEAKPLVEKTYGKIKGEAVFPPQWPVDNLSHKPKTLKKVDDKVKVPVFVRLYRVPSRFAGVAGAKDGVRDAVGLSLLAYVLGGGETSYLYQKLVKEDKLATTLSVSYDYSSKGEASFDVYAEPSEGVTLSELEKEIENALEIFTQKGVDDDDLERAKTTFLASDVYARDDPFVSAYRLGRWLMAGGEAGKFDDWIKEIDYISVSKLKNLSKEYLKESMSTTGYLAKSEELF